MKKSLILYNLIIVFLLTSSHLVSAQQDSTKLKQEVEVVKAYRPSISDAFKINDIPQVEDAKAEKPIFDYHIATQPLFSTFTTEPVQAAEMIGEPRSKLGKGLIKAGIGNYQTPYAELFYNTKVDKKTDFGLHVKHLSSNGNVKLINKDKVDAPQSFNLAELFTKHYFRHSTLKTKLFFERKGFSYYGYAGDTLSDVRKELLIPHWQDKQAFSKGGLQMNLLNEKNKRSETNYDINLNYHYFGSKTGQTEHLAKIGTNMQHDFDSFQGLLNASVSYLRTDSIFNNTSNTYGLKQQILIQIHPGVLFETETASLQVGFNMFTMLDDDDDARVLITPNMSAEWSPAKNVLTLFGGANGYLQHNHYSIIANENPFVDPFQDIENSEHQYILFGGIKGKFSSRLNYRLQIDYASIKNQHFFVLNNFILPSPEEIEPTSVSNTFDVQYDDLKQLTISTEFYYTASDNLNFHLKGNYYSYDMNTLDTPWHKPDYEVTISTLFNPEGPLRFTADIFVIGERKAAITSTVPNFSSQVNVLSMDPVFDLNFGMEYQYSPKLSFFGRANNFAFQKYESWLGYAKQGFNVLIGASYSF